MGEWLDFSFMNDVVKMFDPDILQLFGINAKVMQFSLVFLLVMSLMWVMRPIIEWMMVKRWSALPSYISSAVLTLVFLQTVDRFAMTNGTSLLSSSFWPVSLLAISGFGAVFSALAIFRIVWKKFSKRTKKRAA